MTEIVPVLKPAAYAHLLASIKIIKTFFQSLRLIAVISVLLSAGMMTVAHSYETHDMPPAWQSPLQAGINHSGAFISAGNNVLFLEGVTSKTFQDLTYQGVFGGLIPGLILGSRPYINHAVQKIIPSPASTIPYNIYTLLTLIGYAPNYLFKSLNLINIYNAGAWYLIPNALSEYIYYLDYASSGRGDQDKKTVIRAAGIAFGFILTRLGECLSGARQINLTGDDGFQFFIQIRPQFTEAKLMAVEIHRAKLASISKPNSLTPLGQLAKAMDAAKVDTLFLIPQTTPTGNQLNLSFASENEYGHIQAFTGSINLDLGGNRFFPWLEHFLFNHAPKAGESAVYPPLLSVFQQDILKSVTDFLGCLGNETCSTGTMEPDSDNERSLTYTPYLNKITKQVVSIHQQLEEATVLFSIPGNMTIKNASGELTLSSSRTQPKPVKQFWIPSWFTSAAVAEITSAVRDSAMGLIHGQLNAIAERNNIYTLSPWQFDAEVQRQAIDDYNATERNNRQELDQERYALQRDRDQLARQQRDLREQQRLAENERETQIQRQSRLRTQEQRLERMRERVAQERQNSYALNSREILQWLMVDQDIEVNQAINGTTLTEDQTTRFREIIRESSTWHPGKVMLMKQGMRNEILPERFRDRLHEQRTNLRKKTTDPIGYATFDEIQVFNYDFEVDYDGRYILPQHKPVSAATRYHGIFAGGVTANLPKYNEQDTACLLCLEGSESHPLFGCGRDGCTARMHLHCLDKHFRVDKLKRGRSSKTTAPCPQCQYSIQGESRWY